MARALVLSGGGSFGAFQVGVLKHLMGDLNLKYKVYCGISVGAINCGFLSMYKDSENHRASNELEELWRGLSTAQIYKQWFPFGVLHGLSKNSLYNSSPLKEFIYSILNPDNIKSANHKLRVGAVSLDTGKYKVFDENYPQLADAILASSAFPIMFTPVELENQMWIDGGIRDTTPLGVAIKLGATEIDVILTTPKNVEKQDFKFKKALAVALRSLSVMTDEIADNDIKVAMLINKLVEAGAGKDKRYVKINVYRPDKYLIENPLDFDNDKINKMIDYGYNLVKE